MKTLYLFLISLIFLAPAYTDPVYIDLKIKEHKFIPEIIEAPANQLLKIRIENLDNSVEEFESFDLNREKIVPANGKILVIVGPLKPGEYKFFGEFHEATAQGKILVK